ncbi:protein kinase [bacterium]|nr:protein kinase [bacterium]
MVETAASAPLAARLPIDFRACTSCGFTNSQGGGPCRCCRTHVGDPTPSGGLLASPPPLLESLPARFQPLLLLGRGAQKSVYLARDAVLDRDVAVAAFDTAALGELTHDLLREARIMARVGGTRHVVTVYDVIDTPTAAFIINEFMAGGDLASELARSGPAPLAVERVVQIGLQLCEALVAAHQRGVVHLDVKPSNVLLDGKGDVFLGDFGLARVAELMPRSDGELIGTPAYLAPEQISGGVLDARCDLYGLGSLLYELLVGAPPFEAETLNDLLGRKLRQTPPPVLERRPDVPPALSELVSSLLAIDPSARPAATAVRAALARWASRASRAAGAPRLALPAWFAVEETTAFVGRHVAMAALDRAMAQRVAGPRVIAISGEAGIGKTRLAREFARVVYDDGGSVLLGGASAEPLIPYQPFVEALGRYVRDTAPDTLRAQLASDAVELGRLLPELAERLPEVVGPSDTDTETTRYQMFNAVSRLLAAAAQPGPLLVVLEDLHWADRSTLRLLLHVVAHADAASLVVLLSYRETEVGDAHPLAAALADLHRQQRLERLALDGLAPDDSRKLIVSMTGSAVPPAAVAAIHQRTEGNPFFITETVRHLQGQCVDRPWAAALADPELTVPLGVREVIRQRLSRLDARASQALQAAAVIGRELDADLLGAVTRLDADALVGVLDEAVALALLAEVPDAAARYRFTHALFRETLYTGLTRARRRQLHAAVARAIEVEAAGDADARAADLAHHYEAAGDPARALPFALRAAAAAGRRLAYQESADLYGRALAALAARPPVDEVQRGEIQLAQADALWNAGESATAERMAREIAETARRLGAAPLLARAALAAGGKHSGMQIGFVDEPLVALLEASVAALGDRPDPLRARVMARLAEAITFAPGDPGRRQALARDAIALARRTADLVSLAHVLRHARWALWGPDNAAERLALSSELIELAEASDERGLALSGRGWRMVDLMELGDVEAFERELDTHAREAADLRQPVFEYVTHLRRTMLALLRGRFAEVEQMAFETPGLGERAQIDGARQVFGAQMYSLRQEQGRLAEIEPVLEMMRAQYPHNAGWPVALAYLYAETGRLDEAARELAALAANDFRALPRDLTFNVQLTYLSRLCARVGDAAAARRLYALHLPSAHHFVVAAGTAPLGAAARNLGLLAATMGDDDDAARWFEAALQLNARVDSPPALAHVQADYAALLRRRGRAGAGARAAALAAEARATAAALGMTALAARLDSDSLDPA